jgi:dienelactone hydrolase
MAAVQLNLRGINMRFIAVISLLALPTIARAAEPQSAELAGKLKDLATKLAPTKEFEPLDGPWADARARIQQANDADYAAWQTIKTKEDWEKFRDQRIDALKKSLGQFPAPPKQLNIRITKTIDGVGYKIDNTLFESRPGLWATANLYKPATPRRAMPGIIIIHSHHNPKEQGELQDMGVMWAKAGCCVLVMDQLGHGERREHPFGTAQSFPEPFKVSRQDYYFRYNLGAQLALIGESLVGWMAWDVMRGVDLLLANPSVDPERIILLGSVASGGDASAVAAALDPRIKCLVPFNFGGPQPETRGLVDDADKKFNYAGSGSWESTRNLRDSARDGFLPWVMVASIAPRYLIHAHEFAWNRERDPVWKRYQTIWGFYGVQDRLAFAHGRGSVKGMPPESSHCNNIGPVQRAFIHSPFGHWFGIKAVEDTDRHAADELRCWTDDAKKELKPKSLNQLIADIAERQAAAARKRLELLPPEQWREALGREWAKRLGSAKTPVVDFSQAKSADLALPDCDAADWTIAPGVRALILQPKPSARTGKAPLVVLVARGNRAKLLSERAGLIAELVGRGCAVCVPGLHGSNDWQPNANRGRGSFLTSVSATEQMLGSTLLAAPLADLRLTLAFLRSRFAETIYAERIALCGDSVAPVNAANVRIDLPHDAPTVAAIGEPWGALLAALAALDDPKIKAVACRGGLLAYREGLQRPFLYVPHDALIPNALTAGDLDMLFAALAPRPLRFEAMIDSCNRRLDAAAAEALLSAVRAAHKTHGKHVVEFSAEASPDRELAKWLVQNIK